MSNMTKMIYLVGKTGAGKSTTAQKLQEALIRKAIPAFVVSYGQPLRKFAAKVFGHNDNSLKEIPVAQTTQSTNELVLQLEEFIEDLGANANSAYWEALLPMFNQRVLSPRMLMNAAAQAARSVDALIFVKAMQKTVHELKRQTPNAYFIVEDARFLEEIAAGDIVILNSGERGVLQSVDVTMQTFLREQLILPHTVLDVRTIEAADKSIQDYVAKLLGK